MVEPRSVAIRLTRTPLAGGGSTIYEEGPDGVFEYGPEIVVNGGFETYTTSPGVPDDWSTGAAVTAEKETSIVGEGYNAVKLTRTATGGSSYIKQALSGLIAGRTYAYKYKARPGGSYNCHIKIRNVTDGTDVAGTTTGTSTPGAYADIALDFVPLAGKSYELHAHVNFGGNMGEFAYFDAVSLREKYAPPDPTAGAGRILECSAHLTQSIGDQEGCLRLDNTGGKFAAWASGEPVLIEARRPQDTDFAPLLEGFIGASPQEGPLLRPERSVATLGANSILDKVKLTSDEEYDGEILTTIWADLCTKYLPGYTQEITTDAATGTLTFLQGTNLREAFDAVRRALIAATSPAKWEYQAEKNGSSRKIKLFKRGSSVQRTFTAGDCRFPGTHYDPGSAFHIVNRVVVRGAIKPSTVLANVVHATGLLAGNTGTYTMDSTAKWAALGFEALDSPLSSFTISADRSGAKDPPSLAGYIARNSTNFSALTDAIGRRFFATQTRIRSGLTGTIANLWDYNSGTGVGNTSGVPTDGAFYELIAWDNGVAVRGRYIYVLTSSTSANGQYKLQGSNDDSAWTDIMAVTTSTGGVFIPTTDTTAFRYHRLVYKQSSALSITFQEVRIYEWKNDATDPVSPQLILQRSTPGAISQAFGTTKEHARFDFDSAQAVIKFVWSHVSGSANSQVDFVVQRSADGSNWVDVAILASTSSTVVDNVYLEQEPDFRYVRFITRDTRGSGANISHTTNYVEAYLHAPSFLMGVDGVGNPIPLTTPLAGDQMRGSSWTWTVADLLKHPDWMRKQTWTQPNLALIEGRKYWVVLVPQSGAGANAYWKLPTTTNRTSTGTATNPGVLSNGRGPSIESLDTGSTWVEPTDIYFGDGFFDYILEFNEHELTSQADDAASQALYANFVPNGILVGGYKDEALVTQDMVDREAQALIAARASITGLRRIQLAVDLDPSLLPGNPVTLDDTFDELLGISGTFDVLEVKHEVRPGALTFLVLNSHPVQSSAAIDSALSISSRRTL